MVDDCVSQVWALSYLTDGGNEQIQMVRVSFLDPRLLIIIFKNKMITAKLL